MTSQFEKLLNNALAPLALVLSGVGIVLTVVDSVTKSIDAFETHFFSFAAACYLMATLVIWRWKKRTARGSRAQWLRIGSFILISTVFAAAVMYRYYDAHFKRTIHARVPTSATPPRLPTTSASVPARKVGPSTLVLESLELNTDMSSFHETNERLFAESGARTYRTFAYDNNVTIVAFGRGVCVGPSGNQPLSDVLPILRSHVVKLGRSDLLARLGTAEDLSQIVRQRGDLFSQIMFSPAELMAMMSESSPDYNIVHAWLANCVGLQQPVLTIIVRNDAKSSVLLTHVIYHVLAVGQVLGGVSGEVIPDHTYDHVLKHEKGDQPWVLKPPQQIAPNDRVSFNLRLFAAEEGSGLGWLFNVELVTADGDWVTSELIQIIMKK